MPNRTTKKFVTFNLDKNVTYLFAANDVNEIEARRGTWVQDRMRFQRRIEHLNSLLASVFQHHQQQQQPREAPSQKLYKYSR